MTPKEKAKELANKMHIESDIIYIMSKVQAKKCSLIAVQEILNILEYPSPQYSYYLAVNIEIDKMKYTKEQAEKLKAKNMPDVKIEFGYYIIESKINFN